MDTPPPSPLQGVLQSLINAILPYVQVLHVRGRDENLKSIQPHLDPVHLTMLNLSKEVYELEEVCASDSLVSGWRWVGLVVRMSGH